MDKVGLGEEKGLVAAVSVKVLRIVYPVIVVKPARCSLGFCFVADSEVSAPQITSNIGNSFVQLLTTRAVLIALEPTGEGGEIGCI